MRAADRLVLTLALAAGGVASAGAQAAQDVQAYDAAQSSDSLAPANETESHPADLVIGTLIGGAAMAFVVMVTGHATRSHNHGPG